MLISLVAWSLPLSYRPATKRLRAYPATAGFALEGVLAQSLTFKLFFDVNSSPALTKLYSDLTEVRRYYRNIPVHASPEFFFYLESFGLVPSDYSALEYPHMLHPIAFEPDEAARILKMFEECLALFSSEGTVNLAKIYAESGLPFAISQEGVEELREYMVTSELFAAEMRRRAAHQDAVDNMEI